MVPEVACVVSHLIFQLLNLFLQGLQLATWSRVEALPVAERQPSRMCSCCEKEELRTHYYGLEERLSGGYGRGE